MEASPEEGDQSVVLSPAKVPGAHAVTPAPPSKLEKPERT
jgi:hypothetical protein